MQGIEKAFKILGLNEKETKIMLALSVMSHFSESSVSRVTKLPRTTIIPILQKLKKRGFVQEISVLGHKRWKIEDFERIRRKILTAYEVFRAPSGGNKIDPS